MDSKLIIVLILLITIYFLYYYKRNTNWIIVLSIFNIFVIIKIIKSNENFYQCQTLQSKNITKDKHANINGNKHRHRNGHHHKEHGDKDKHRDGHGDGHGHGHRDVQSNEHGPINGHHHKEHGHRDGQSNEHGHINGHHHKEHSYKDKDGNRHGHNYRHKYKSIPKAKNDESLNDLYIDSVINNNDKDLLYTFVKDRPHPHSPVTKHVPKPTPTTTIAKPSLLQELKIEKLKFQSCINANCNQHVSDLLKDYDSSISSFVNKHNNYTTNYKTELKNNLKKIDNEIEKNKYNDYFYGDYKGCLCNNRECSKHLNKIKSLLAKIMSRYSKIINTQYNHTNKLDVVEKEISKNRLNILSDNIKYSYSIFYKNVESICRELDEEVSSDYEKLINILNEQRKELDDLENDLVKSINNYNNKLKNKYKTEIKDDDIVDVILRIKEE